MPSLVVHYALTGLLAATLLGAAFDKRSLALSLVVVTLPDADAFIALYAAAGHRAATTNLVIPAVLAVVLAIDLYAREESYIRRRWGSYGVRLAWFSVFLYAVAHVLFDAVVTGGANLFWPLHDKFYVLQGDFELSSQRGVVQSFVELDTNGGTNGGVQASVDSYGNTSSVQMSTAVNPGSDGEGGTPERIFPIARGGWQLYLLVVGTVVTVTRLIIGHDLPEE